jgi:hypothetical protein
MNGPSTSELTQLSARLLADPLTEEIAAAEGLSTAAYVDATLAYLSHPEAGFRGVVDRGDDWVADDDWADVDPALLVSETADAYADEAGATALGKASGKHAQSDAGGFTVPHKPFQLG